jgi:hypothetical protein
LQSSSLIGVMDRNRYLYAFGLPVNLYFPL